MADERTDAQPGTSAEDKAQKLEEVEKEFIDCLKRFPKGINDVDVQIQLPELTAEQRVHCINSLLSKGILDLFNQGGKLIYKYKEKASSQVSKGSDAEEKVVLRIIEQEGNKGMWIRDIRSQSNLLPTQLNKILKALENKKLIKAVKPVSACKKKMYMLYHLEPDKSVTGGPWYSAQDFDAEFVGMLSQQCYRYLQLKQEKARDSSSSPRDIRNKAYATSTDVWKFISELGISTIQLNVEDIETILDTIVYDGKVEKYVSVDLTKMYRAVETLLPHPGIVQAPCGVCPVISFCSNKGHVTPSKCEYFKQWLDA